MTEDKTKDQIRRSFTRYSTRADQTDQAEVLRASARGFAELIADSCPNSRERSLALTKVEEAVMWATAAIINAE